jgi:hypothetical protein
LVSLGHSLNSRFLLHPLLSDLLATSLEWRASDNFRLQTFPLMSSCGSLYLLWKKICLLVTCFRYLFKICLKGHEMTNPSEHFRFSLTYLYYLAAVSQFHEVQLSVLWSFHSVVRHFLLLPEHNTFCSQMLEMHLRGSKI